MPSTTADRIDGITTSAAVKVPVRVAATSAITLSGAQTIDGVFLTAGSDRVLVTAQTDQTTNGIYLCQTSAWTREPDFDGARDAVKGTEVRINEGTLYANTIWRLTTASPVTIGTDNITFSRYDNSAPSFSPTGAAIPTNGLYLPASNSVGISSNGGLAFSVGYYAGSGTPVNSIQVLNVGSGFFPVIQPIGANTNISLLYDTKGTGGHIFNTGGPTNNGVTQFIIAHAATAVNYIQSTGAAASSSPSISAMGSDTDVSLKLRSQGIGTIDFCSGLSNSNVNFRVFAGTSPVVNYAYAQGAATGAVVQMGALGSDTNITLQISSKGTGSIDFFTNNQSTRQFSVTHTATAVNYFSVSGSATGGRLILQANGTDSSIGVSIYSKGTSGIQFNTAGGTDLHLAIAANAGAVNSIQIQGGTTGNGPTLSAQGETNVDLILSSKGSGLLKMGIAGMTIVNGSVATVLGSVGPVGSHTTVQKWLQLKDSGGTTLFVPCF